MPSACVSANLLMLIASILPGRCVFVDAEHALDQSFAEKIGVDISNLLLSQPDTGEQALAITDTLIKSGSIDVVVVDSVSNWHL